MFSTIESWKSKSWFSAVLSAFGLVVLETLAFVLTQFDANVATAGALLLIVVVLLSALGTYFSAVFLSLVAVECLADLSNPPMFSFRILRQEDIVAITAFLASSMIVTGIAARRRQLSEGELRRARTELARFARVSLLGELTASIAHEVNQPLAGLVSNSDACRRWLASQPPNIERANEALARVIRDADLARKVVERIRGLAKNGPVERTAVRLDGPVREVILLARPEAEQHKIRLEAQFADGLPPVWADRIQLQQVCLNLVLNAIESIKETRDGPRDVTVRLDKDVSGGALLTVSDTGVGLKSVNIDGIFEPFYTTKAGGIGMGLAISRSIIESHGGRLWASSNVPRGAKFQVALPFCRESAS